MGFITGHFRLSVSTTLESILIFSNVGESGPGVSFPNEFQGPGTDPGQRVPEGFGFFNDDDEVATLHFDSSPDGVTFTNDGAYAAGPLVLQPGGSAIIQLNNPGSYAAVQIRGSAAVAGISMDATAFYRYTGVQQ